MVSVRRNSREFKKVQQLIQEYAHKKSRRRAVNLYALKPGEGLAGRMLIDHTKSIPRADVLYDMNYSSLLTYFSDPRYKLYRDTGIYFFKTSRESPLVAGAFAITGRIKKTKSKQKEPAV